MVGHEGGGEGGPQARSLPRHHHARRQRRRRRAWSDVIRVRLCGGLAHLVAGRSRRARHVRCGAVAEFRQSCRAPHPGKRSRSDRELPHHGTTRIWGDDVTDAVITANPGEEIEAQDADRAIDEKAYGFWIYLATDAIIFALLFAIFVAMSYDTADKGGGHTLFWLP